MREHLHRARIAAELAALSVAAAALGLVSHVVEPGTSWARAARKEAAVLDDPDALAHFLSPDYTPAHKETPDA